MIWLGLYELAFFTEAGFMCRSCFANLVGYGNRP
jgi:hypothetical protein